MGICRYQLLLVVAVMGTEISLWRSVGIRARSGKNLEKKVVLP